MPGTNGNFRVDLPPEHGRGALRLLDALARNRRVEGRVLHRARRGIVDALEQQPRDAKARSDDAARVARMHALGQHFHRQHAVHEAAQRGGAPELLVVAAARIEADHEVGCADARRERFQIRRQIVAAGFLAALDHDRAARVRAAVLAQGAQGRNRCEHRVAVVRAAAAVEPALADDGRPRPKAVGPAGHFRLLVEVAVEEHGAGVLGAGCRWNLDEEQRRAALEPHHLQLHARDGVLPAPARRQLDRGVDMAVLRPGLVEMRRLGGNPDVVGQGRDMLSFQNSRGLLHVLCGIRAHRSVDAQGSRDP